ncbi:MAG: porin [Pseudomonadota bacterium]
MKKNVIALAVATAMAAPMAAQAEVTVSGVLQAEIVSVSGDTPRDGTIAMQDASTIGGGQGSHNVGGVFINASEDLGGGLKGLAKYGVNVDVDNRTYRTTRDAYVGLSGGFGTVLMGRMSSPYKTSTVKWDPFLATFMQARGNGGASGGVAGHGSYLDETLAYANKFGAVKVVAGIALDETEEGNHAMSFSANVPMGPVELALGYINASEHDAYANGVVEDASATKIGLKYNGGAFGMMFQHEIRDEGLGDGSYTLLGANFASGANTFALNYGMNDVEANGEDTTYMALGMKHAFSKTTGMHLGYKTTDQDGYAEDIVGLGLRVKF